MKTLVLKLRAPLVGVLALGAAPLSQAGTATFEWQEPDKYTDMGDSGYFNPSTFNSFKREMEGYIGKLVDRYLPEGQELKLTVTDVDLAGEFEPWHRSPFDDVRIVRAIYTPKISFSYTLRDEAGKVISDGKQKLVGQGFEYNVGRRYFNEDTFFYEKDLLGNWIRSQFKSKKKK